MTHLIIDKITVNFHEAGLVDAPTQGSANVDFAVRLLEQPNLKNDQTQRTFPHRGISFVSHFSIYTNGTKIDSSRLLLPFINHFYVYFRSRNSNTFHILFSVLLFDSSRSRCTKRSAALK